MALSYKEMYSPVGKLKLVASPDLLVAVLWEHERRDRVKLDPPKPASRHPILRETERQLKEYFLGKRSEFGLPLRISGSEFQIRVWRALREIPFGQTKSYRELAIAVRSHPRAVGFANSKNPLSIIVPCHRLVGSDGSLTGYAGGLRAKADLLAFEARVAAASPN